MKRWKRVGSLRTRDDMGVVVEVDATERIRCNWSGGRFQQSLNDGGPRFRVL